MSRKFRLVLTDNCNLNCKNCYNEGSLVKNTQRMLDCDLICRFLSKIKDYVKSIVLTGGEPLLSPSFLRLVDDLYDFKFYVQLTTNGLLLNNYMPHRETLNKISRINISLDSTNELNFRYGTKTSPELYQKLLYNLKELLSFHNYVSINTVYGKENYSLNWGLDFLDFCIKNKVQEWKLIPILDEKEEDTSDLKIALRSIGAKENFISKQMHKFYIDGLEISFIRQTCALGCDVCKKESFVRIDSDSVIYYCRKDHSYKLPIRDIVDLPPEQIIQTIEKGFSELLS